MTERMKQILVLVGERKEKMAKDLFKERASSDIQPFIMAIKFSNVEKFLWGYSCKMALFSVSEIRDRFQHLMSLNGLCMESLYLADLSDLCDFIFHQKNERDPY